ncbi:MAG: response regulator [Calditrichaceae bacterium]|nr:response regulator [Calditrichaceae bacterium]
MAKSLRVLIVDDSEDDTLLLVRALKSGGYNSHYERVDTATDLVKALENEEWDIVITDYSMPRFSAPAAIEIVKQKELEIPIIIVSGAIGEEIAVSALRAGAQDFINKNNLSRLVPAVERELRETEVRRQRQAAQEEKTKIEEQLFQAQKMEAIGRLTGGVAHDFNNLLTVINGYSDLILSNLKKNDPNFENIQKIRQAGRRAENLTRQLLAFSRKQALKPVVLDLNDLILNMEDLLRRLIGEDIDLIIALDKNLDYIKADPGQMEQVILNLVINSRDSMPQGGKIIIETENVILDKRYAEEHHGSFPGKHVMLVITDTGSGMDNDTKSKIFEPFFTTKEKGKGTGLGLSMVYGIVKQSGGSIYVYSELNKGTTFKIFLKSIDEEIEIIPEFKKTPEKLDGTETILVVEDEEAVLELAIEVLKDYGYNVLEASTAEAALEMINKSKEPIHLLLTDIVLPGKNGHELAKEVNSIHPEIKILYMSGYTESVIGNHGMLDEKINLIQKPYSPIDLLRKVRKTLNEAK